MTITHDKCPHSTAIGARASTCSQCQMAKARLVTYDPETRSLVIDGKAEERPSDVENKSPPNANRKTIGGGRRQITCGLCGRVGHTRQSCTNTGN